MRQKLPAGEARLNALLRAYRQNAASRNLEWRLTDEEFKYQVRQPCFYCEAPPAALPMHRGWSYNGTTSANGLDRIDSSAGYTRDNVRTCCSLCNSMKSNRDTETYVAHAIRVAARFARLYKENPLAFE